MGLPHVVTERTPLRFCIVSTFYPPYNFGGDGIYAHRLANGLARLGHRVTVLHSPSAYEALAGAPPAAPYADHPNVSVRAVRTPAGKWGLLLVHQTGRPTVQAPALRAGLDDAAYDVIHYNNVSLLGGPEVFHYGSGVKLCTLIDHWLVCPLHVLWKLDREVCTQPTCVRCTLAARRPPQLWRYGALLQRATRCIDAFLGPSLFTIRMHQERGIRGTMIQLPLFHSELQPTAADAADANDSRPYVLFSGRLEKIKGVQDVIPVFRGMSGVDLVVAGTGTFETALRSLAAGADNIRFIGRRDQAQLHALYRDAVATIVPSVSYETFGLVVVESFAAQTPVVVRAHSSLAEIVSTHGGGLMYRSADELRAAIGTLRGDAMLRDRLGRAGRAAYDAEFSEGAFMAHYLAVVHELLARKRTGHPPSAGSPTTFAGRPIFFAAPQDH